MSGLSPYVHRRTRQALGRETVIVMLDVQAWLRRLGLSQYEQAFRDHRIDCDVLADLTDGDLEELGVSLGDRRRLLRAIAELSAPEPSSAPAWPAPAAAPRSLPGLDPVERRPVTIMFCDLVGSTELAAALDLEDWRNLLNAYLDEASEAVTGLGGRVLKRLGDGLMAVFGYPQAQENDAERAVRAALGVQQALGEVNARNRAAGAPGLAVRIGLESGPVVVDAAGEVFGEAPNIAARVQAAAESGTVLVTSTVQRQVAGLFIVEDKGAHELRGAPAPVNLYRIVRSSGERRRRGARLLTPFVGREDHLAVMACRLEQALAGKGQFVLIVGEPGIGKSRLIEEFRGRMGETPHTWIEWSASQLLRNTPLHPVLAWGRARFGGPETAPERRLIELESLLAEIGLDPGRLAPLLAPMVGVPLPPERLLKLAAEEIRRGQLAAMAEWAAAAARTQPLVLVFEDLQWFDPTSIDLVHGLSERGAEAPILVLATARPEFRPPWDLKAHHEIIAVAPLGEAEVQRMINELASRRALPANLTKRVGERAGGVPLFVEEVTRFILERGERGAAQAIPPTLRQSLAARLDRLGPAREVAQVGAVLGRSFPYALLRAVASEGESAHKGFDEASLASALAHLLDADILFADGVPPDATFCFKHALIQDSAYDSLLRSRRQALHRRAAAALIAAQSEPEPIARHFTAAGAKKLAVVWWGNAGEEALGRSAFKEAIAHLGKAIALAEETEREAPGTGARDPAFADRLLKLNIDYGHAAMWLKGFAADEMSAAYARASCFAGSPDESHPRFVAYYGECLKSFVRGEYRKAHGEAEAFLRDARDQGRATEAGVARRLLGFVSLQLGDLRAARNVLERTLSDYVRERDRGTLFRFGNDTEVSATNFLALTEWHLGDFERARQLIDESTRRANELGHSAAVASAFFFRTVIESRRGDAPATRVAVESLLQLTQERNLKTYTDLGRMYSNWARGKLFDPAAGALGLREALASYLAIGNRSGGPGFHGLIAELEAMRPDFESALSEIDAGLAIAEETGEHVTDPYLYRLRGEFLLMRSPGAPSAAREAFQTAIAIAEGQGARGYALIASHALARLCQSTGRADEARAILAPALEGLSPTPEAPEIAEAQALFARLT
ncbi:MAG TPA: adenylate/guanylate cyclase domain-containing protein [Roseiarcus sp.]|nr:adenylate/guanylate cyclase domain-containing protein [Roseiarcus sp.]